MTKRMPLEVPRRRINAIVVNGDLVDVFEALCLIEGRRAHQLVHDIVADYCRDRRNEPEVQELVRIHKAWRVSRGIVAKGSLRLIEGSA